MIFGDVVNKFSRLLGLEGMGGGSHMKTIRGMSVGDLLTLNERLEFFSETLKPVHLEYDYFLLEKISRTPNMTLGEVRDFLNSRDRHILEAVSSEIKRRESEGTLKYNHKKP